MRILFIIVGLSGLLLVGLVVPEMRTASELSLQMQAVQSNYSNLSRVAAASGIGYALNDDCLSYLIDETNALKIGWIGVAVCCGILLLIAMVGILVEKKSRKQAVPPISGGLKSTFGLIVLAIILAGCSWPLLYIALVRAQIKFYDLPTMIVFLSWIASGLFWGVFVGLLYRLIRYKRPNTFLEPTTTEPRVLTDYEI